VADFRQPPDGTLNFLTQATMLQRIGLIMLQPAEQAASLFAGLAARQGDALHRGHCSRSDPA
jgi:hypothetical protein